ncbi:hypothetical protein [Riemerella anatipestifer]|uniref:hypothetical protein n=1 Tax=Riemerella anatipestifer TaxID=34085 RepID=UPI00129DABC9|nr:hypothetical protein [Riemerella anatipestifer]MBT0551160.1 hypothetical protein [Riemerella anatipestifer]MBT0552985.1 hypothetical protein [Riemerella anatipestifer]MCE3025246.1 hypothetical protein [Riemerella anatipestifer]MCU7558693.1 hypothetical protein [Riemerella anatipestifer]MDY3448386.1 hypothetical protein [Riemerella anatipestifer]
MRKIALVVLAKLILVSCFGDKKNDNNLISSTDSLKIEKVKSYPIEKNEELLSLSKKEVKALSRSEQIEYLSNKYDDLQHKYKPLYSLSDEQFYEIRDLYLDGVFETKGLCMACIEHNALLLHRDKYSDDYLEFGYFKKNFPNYKGKNMATVLAIYCPILCVGI